MFIEHSAQARHLLEHQPRHDGVREFPIPDRIDNVTVAPPHDMRDDRRPWAREVVAALDALDPISAAALRLIYQRDTTQAQAAARLGIAETEVKTLIARGLQRLADSFGRSLELT